MNLLAELIPHAVSARCFLTLFPHIRTDSRRYYALTPLGTQKTLLHRRFEEWLIEQGRPDDASTQ